MRTPLIGIAGKARSGKDTVGNFIVSAVGGYCFGFADPIRSMMRQIGIDMSDPYWTDHKEEVIPALGVSPRYLMQTLGTEWGRELVNPDLWVTIAKQRVLSSGSSLAIATDVRFENEAAWIRDMGGTIIHIRRKLDKNDQHASEAGVAVQPSDITIDNDRDLEDLQHATHEALVYCGLLKT
jgi:hypothetical protein